jgi:hypothetical protein
LSVARVSREAKLGVSLESAVKVLSDRPFELLGGELAMFTSQVFGLAVGAQVRVVPGDLVTVDQPLELAVLPFRLEAERGPGWFPVLDAELEVISTADCGIDVAMEGEYHPPGGVLGAVVDRAGLHRLADDAIDQFFRSIVGRLRTDGSALDALAGVPV